MVKKYKDKSIICILGGTGFIGRHLVKVLAEAPAIEAKILSRNKNKNENLSKHLRVEEGDLLNLDSLVSFLEPGATVINLAFLRKQPIEINIRATINLAEACVRVGVARLIHCSSAEVVGRVSDDVITEDTICSPVTEYERTKFGIEKIMIESIKSNCEVVIIRPTAVFGEDGENLLKLAKELVSESRLIRMIKTSLYLKRRMNLVCVENVVESILFLARFNRNITGEYYIISDDEEEENNYYGVTQLLAKLQGLRQVDIFRFPFQPLILSILLSMLRRSNTNPNRIYSSKKLVNEGFKKPISFQEGIIRFASWFKNRELGKSMRTL